MKRIATPTRVIDLFGPGKDGFKNGDLANGVQPTNLEADWCNQLQEELATAVEASGQALDPNVRTQLLKALRRMTGGYVRTVTAGHTVLTADDAGLVLVNATAGAVTIALPQANVLKALPLTFRRLDATGNAVTISVAGTGADVINTVDTSFALVGSDIQRLISDGAMSWHSIDGITQAQGDARYILASLGITQAQGDVRYILRSEGVTQAQGDVRYILASSVDDTGKVASFMRSTAPIGYIKADGGTIGSAASGATTRAHADTLKLFTLFWAEFDNALLHIQDSAGTPTIRGASAAADWAANKRLPVFDRRGYFGRGWDNGAGIDPGRILGSVQADDYKSHSHANDIYTHLLRAPYAGSTTGSYATGSGSEQAVGAGDGAAMLASGGTETRPKNIAELVCIKL